MALELSSYDLLPQSMPSFARGFAAALIATVSCYPLDTVRRHIQLQAGRSVAYHTAAAAILRDDGIAGMYRGFVPNALKNLPNKGARPPAAPRCQWRLLPGRMMHAIARILSVPRLGNSSPCLASPLPMQASSCLCLMAPRRC